MTFTERLDAWIEASKERERAAKLRRENRTPKQRLKARIIGLSYWAFLTSAIVFTLGGLKGVAFIAKVLFVALHVGAMMDIDLDASDRQAAVNGMLKALDKNSGAISQRSLDTFINGKDNQKLSPGILIADENGATITAIQNGSPAHKAGLKIGDRIISIYDQDVSESFAGAEALVSIVDTHSEEDHIIPITVQRGPETVSIEMKMFPWEPQTAYDLGVEDSVLHVAIPLFVPGVAGDVESIISGHLETTEVDAVMIDLRGNPGGLSSEKADLAALFVPEGTVIAKLVGRRAFDDIIKTKVAEKFPEIERIGVIIDGGSASASEGFAAFVRDHELGPIAGEKSYGKGSQQALLGFKAAISPFRITVARFTGPNGTTIDGVGITPDIALARGEDDRPDWADLIAKLRAELAAPI